MRKYLIGAIFGIALTIASSTYADDIKSLIGSKVQGEFPVKINGEQLSDSAIVINGTSYLPNRAIAGALGMDIKFDADLGIELTKEEVLPLTTSEPETNEEEELFVTDIAYSESSIESAIMTCQTMIDNLKDTIETNQNKENVPIWQEKLKYYEEQLSLWESRKAALTQ